MGNTQRFGSRRSTKLVIGIAVVLWALSAVVVGAMIVAPAFTYRFAHVLMTGRDALPPTGFAAHHDKINLGLERAAAAALVTWAVTSLVAGAMALFAWRSEYRAARQLAATLAERERQSPTSRER